MSDTIWRPDTCQCRINYTKQSFIKRCRLHQGSTFREVIAHNTDPKWRDKEEAKKEERDRIRKLT